MDWPNPVFWTFSFVWYHHQQALRANPWKSCRVLMGKKFYGTMFYLSTVEFLSNYHDHCFGQHCNFTLKKMVKTWETIFHTKLRIIVVRLWAIRTDLNFLFPRLWSAKCCISQSLSKQSFISKLKTFPLNFRV